MRNLSAAVAAFLLLQIPAAMGCNTKTIAAKLIQPKLKSLIYKSEYIGYHIEKCKKAGTPYFATASDLKKFIEIISEEVYTDIVRKNLQDTEFSRPTVLKRYLSLLPKSQRLHSYNPSRVTPYCSVKRFTAYIGAISDANGISIFEKDRARFNLNNNFMRGIQSFQKECPALEISTRRLTDIAIEMDKTESSAYTKAPTPYNENSTDISAEQSLYEELSSIAKNYSFY